MKSSVTTRSAAPPLLTSRASTPNAPVSDVIRTRAMIADANFTPTKECPVASERTGAANAPSFLPALSKDFELRRANNVAVDEDHAEGADGSGSRSGRDLERHVDDGTSHRDECLGGAERVERIAECGADIGEVVIADARPGPRRRHEEAELRRRMEEVARERIRVEVRARDVGRALSPVRGRPNQRVLEGGGASYFAASNAACVRSSTPSFSKIALT